MWYRTLKIKVISAQELEDERHGTNMDMYAIGLLSGDLQTIQKTTVDTDSATNPTWNYLMEFTLDESLAQQNRLFLLFLICCGNRVIRGVKVPVKELLETVGGGNTSSVQFIGHQLTDKPSGRPQGVLNFSYEFGEMLNGAVPEMSQGVEGSTTNRSLPYHQQGVEGSTTNRSLPYHQPPPVSYPPLGGYPHFGAGQWYPPPLYYPHSVVNYGKPPPPLYYPHSVVNYGNPPPPQPPLPPPPYYPHSVVNYGNPPPPPPPSYYAPSVAASSGLPHPVQRPTNLSGLGWAGEWLARLFLGEWINDLIFNPSDYM